MATWLIFIWILKQNKCKHNVLTIMSVPVLSENNLTTSDYVPFMRGKTVDVGRKLTDCAFVCLSVSLCYFLSLSFSGIAKFYATCTFLSFWYYILIWYVYKVQCCDRLLKMLDIVFCDLVSVQNAPVETCASFVNVTLCTNATFCFHPWWIVLNQGNAEERFRWGWHGKQPRQEPAADFPHIMHAIVLSEGTMGCMENLHD